MKLSIIIVSWNTRAFLKSCLDSVYMYPPQCEFDIWVVDNGSTDDSVVMIQAEYPEVKLIVNQHNPGFAGANNQAIVLSDAPYMLLLNPDTEVRPGALQYLVDFMEDNPLAGAAGARLLNPDGSLQESCHPMPTLARELWRLLHLDGLIAFGCYEMDNWHINTVQEVDVLQGAALILRQSVLDKIGLLDETYFMYSEEVDLCYRLQQAGWRLYWVPQSEVVHYGGQSTRQMASQMFVQLYKAKLMFFHKNYGRNTARAYKGILVLAAMVRLLFSPLAYLYPRETRERWLFLARHYRLLLFSLPKL